MTLTPAERAAQRSLVGLVQTGAAQLDSAEGLRIWRASGSEEWQIGVDEVAGHFETLGIPHHIALVRRTVRRRPVAGFEVRVGWDDLPAVLRWVPSLQRLIDAVNEPVSTPSSSGWPPERFEPQGRKQGGGRRNHHWRSDETRDGDVLVSRCRNCGMQQRSDFYQVDGKVRNVIQWSRPDGSLLVVRPITGRGAPKSAPPYPERFAGVPIAGSPECPKSPAAWDTSG